MHLRKCLLSFLAVTWVIRVFFAVAMTTAAISCSSAAISSLGLDRKDDSFISCIDK